MVCGYFPPAPLAVKTHFLPNTDLLKSTKKIVPTLHCLQQSLYIILSDRVMFQEKEIPVK